VKNLFLTDGAPFCSNADKNPTLTIMALAWRTTNTPSSRCGGRCLTPRAWIAERPAQMDVVGRWGRWRLLADDAFGGIARVVETEQGMASIPIC